ncbi:MAG: sigma-E processing peptidase SpoIIGA [Firmicutes bacterium]|jgi:stage II sporulation protein GA (sporulation sigma-E factor processing peptidase)|nr:sigma-E processing peptidase SpoIIGA [Bacillota bacterium]NLO66233.1 sigma-E processing peptidase SpoIIGA [Bacillota bacterium]
MPKYILYVDVWLLRLGCNFLLVYLLLWATASITRTRTRPVRLFLASALGTLHYFLYLLASVGLIPFYGLLQFLPVIVLISLAMLLVSFYPLSAKKLLSVAGYFYGIGFIAAGAGLAGAYLLGSAANPIFPLGTVISIITLLAVAELGWGVVHERIVNQVYRVPVEIYCDNAKVKVDALVDTGNNLRDPLTNQPVIVVEHSVLQELLPQDIGKLVTAVENNELNVLETMVELDEWRTRVRLIPFTSLGKKNGLMLGFRSDGIRIAESPMNNSLQPTIAIYPHTLDPNNEYRALIPPTAVQGSLQSVDSGVEKGGEAHAGPASADF